MNKRPVLAVLGLFLAALLAVGWSLAGAEEGRRPCPPDPELCAKMLRFGKENYHRGRMPEAKHYFREAVKADPTSEKAWAFYDLTVIKDLAYRAMTLRGVELPAPPAPAAAGEEEAAAPPPPAPSKEKPTEFVIVDDEGC